MTHHKCEDAFGMKDTEGNTYDVYGITIEHLKKEWSKFWIWEGGQRYSSTKLLIIPKHLVDFKRRMRSLGYTNFNIKLRS